MGLFGIGSAIGGLAQSAASVINTNKTNASNEYINSQNLQFQRENLDYQKALQQRIFEREDSSYQRTVNDMRLAGLSPLSMNGTNGAGEAIATTPLNAGQPNQYNYQAPTFDLPNFVQLAQQYQMNQEEIRSKRLDNDMKEDTYDTSLFQQRFDLISKYYDSLDKQRKEEFNRFFGINSNMSPDERKMQIYGRAFNLGQDLGMNQTFVGPLFKKHGEFNEYLNNLFSSLGSTTYYINPDVYSKAFTGKEMLKTGLDYASQFVKFFNIFNRSKKSKNNDSYDDILNNLPF